MKRGQGNTEFIVLVALIAIATIGIVTLYGDNVRRLFGGSSDTLGGDPGLAAARSARVGCSLEGWLGSSAAIASGRPRA